MTLLDQTLTWLLQEADNLDEYGYAHFRKHLPHFDVTTKLRLLHDILCERRPEPALPEEILHDIETLLKQRQSHRLLVDVGSLMPVVSLQRNHSLGVQIKLWRGDITTLLGVTAIANAANEQMLGCFQPSHRCIDNVIHSWAGPGLREECFGIMQARGQPLFPGQSIVTRGHALASPYVVHAVGPQLRRGAKPTKKECEQLASCYRNMLEDVESLPAQSDGRKAVALCCISTGLFAFPIGQAAHIAAQAVYSWFEERSSTTITDVIFNVFTEKDLAVYQEILSAPTEPWLAHEAETARPVSVYSSSLGLAREWLDSADAILVTAGAGLSAADGLDYTSTSLFKKHFPGFLKYGLDTLYSVFGFSAWPSEQDRWGYFFTHLDMVQKWPKSPMYGKLLSWLEKSEADVHVRTSNADGLFLANGWPEEQLSTPQGSYSVLQCLRNCRPDAVVLSAPLVEQAQPFLEPITQRLSDPNLVPLCQFCGGKMSICVRAGSWFNEAPFRRGEARWREFRRRALDGNKRLVILEIGAGFNTPSVLRWPNEDLVVKGRGNVRLIRIGAGVDSAVPPELEEQGLATYIDGDGGVVISQLLSSED